MSQRQSDMVHQLSKEMAYRLRYFFSSHDPAKVELCQTDLADEVHAFVCGKLGIEAASARNAGHPWNRRGYARRKPG